MEYGLKTAALRKILGGPTDLHAFHQKSYGQTHQTKCRFGVASESTAHNLMRRIHADADVSKRR
ncbi:hypothetical protein AAMO2058_001725900 [Amorphochlora amoebiformis]